MKNITCSSDIKQLKKNKEILALITESFKKTKQNPKFSQCGKSEVGNLIVDFIQKKQLKWLGTFKEWIICNFQEYIEWHPHGKQKKGRPRKNLDNWSKRINYETKPSRSPMEGSRGLGVRNWN